MARNPEFELHQQWIAYVHPVGLLVSPPALVTAQAFANRNIVRQQQVLRRLVENETLQSLPAFCVDVLGWRTSDLAGALDGPPLPDSLSVPLLEYGETLAPTFAVPDPDQLDHWLMLIQVLPAKADFDATAESATETDTRHWQASSQARFERLLRETEIPVGLLFNGVSIRVVYAPRGESSGHGTFRVKDMTEVAGRPILSALHMLLEADRLFTLPTNQRLHSIFRESRKYQSEVSNALAEQVFDALNELLRGFQAADAASQHFLFRDMRTEARSEIYGGLLTSLMRLVFILYAEDRGLLPGDSVYTGFYSVAGLFERLRDDASRYPDTMDQRYGAWAQLVTLFRLIYDGGDHGPMHLPRRYGRLFDPDAYPFLEGRPYRTHRVMGDTLEPPRVSDGVVYRVLENLLVLAGDRLSYRALDVEQIGSVYEAMMGYELEVAADPSIAVRPHHVVVNLNELLEKPAADRAKFLKETAGCEITGQSLDSLKAANTWDEAGAALGRKVSPRTPRVLPVDAMYLQPSEERRRSGSHYTPRSLTEPIVRTTLRPIFERLGERPTPDQILDLKVCDPAMGSGAFLVEACRVLGDRLVEAWQFHGQTPTIPLDEDPYLHARRLVAQRCLYGVDKNPFAVDLAKLSLWLATLARDHPFTFLDHALRNGDSLVGLTCEQIMCFNWVVEAQIPLLREFTRMAVKKALDLRHRIEQLADSDDSLEKSRLLQAADEAIDRVRIIGDCVIAAFFASDKTAERKVKLKEYWRLGEGVLAGTARAEAFEEIVAKLRNPPHPLSPFHWELEYPEVFSRDNAGFDAIVGNPPFGGKNTIINSHRDNYLPFLQATHAESHGNADLVAHFFRRAFEIIRNTGAFGLIATNTIAQGDTRSTGLRWICLHGGTIYEARKRLKWPGQAAVIVSLIHIAKMDYKRKPVLIDGRLVPQITAFLFHAGGHENPVVLKENAEKSFQGPIVLGMGFTFDDTDKKGVASSLSEMRRLIEKDSRNAERIFPYIGGEEINDSPTQEHHRYVINFGDMTEDEAKRWPDLLAIVEERVKPERMKQKDELGREKWWLFLRPRPEMQVAIASLERQMVIPFVSKFHAVSFVSPMTIVAGPGNVIALESFDAFCVLQARPHELWARFFASSLKDDPRYTPTDCFETFPFPPEWRNNPSLESVGRAYYELRAGLMVRNNQGLTATYNRFHDPEDRDSAIAKLRELHVAMDRAVLDAYGWSDLHPTCEFLLDYEEEEVETGSRRKKPWRYRWPDEFRDEVLARSLELNRQRAEQEMLDGPAAKEKKPRKQGPKKPTAPAKGDTLFR